VRGNELAQGNTAARSPEETAGGGAPLNASKRRAYLWGGALLLAIGLGTGALNLVLQVPPYQEVGWLMVGFFTLSGAAGIAVARSSTSGSSKAVEYGEAIVVAILLAVAIRGTVIQAFKIPSGSMLPTLQIGDHLLVTKLLYGPRIPYTDRRLFRIAPPRAGDIVVFAYPVEDSKDFIKRVVAVPGETVEIRRKQVFIDGKPLDDPWGRYVDRMIVPPGYGEDSKRDNFGPARVPEGQYFVLGDNRDKSYDSRFWGFVEDARIRGKAVVLYWSWDSESEVPFWKVWDRIRWGRIGTRIR
jgi:signal peptidase I